MNQENSIQEIRTAVLRLERKNRRLNWGFYTLLILFAATVFSSAVIDKTNAEASGTADSVLRVRGLIVTDANGKDRVHIGAPLPDPLLQGKRLKRNGSISGILLMDADGTERSGYFTSDDPGTVALTLDTAAGQTAMFLANDERGANLQIHDFDNRHSVRLIAVGNAPNIVVTRLGEDIFQVPEAKKEEKK